MMADSSIPISIVIPVFNNSDSIVNALDSCTNQTFLPKEIIVVDDNSSDDSFLVVEQWKERYKGVVKITLLALGVNSGPSVARNRGWELASGDYVSFLDADDKFLANKLETIVPILRDNQDIVLLAHGYALKEHKEEYGSNLQYISSSVLLKKNLFTTPTVTLKSSVLERFDEEMRYTEDHDLWLRITQKYNKTYFIENVLTVISRPVRAVGGQSANLWGMRKGEIYMYKKYCKDNALMVLFPMFLGYSLAKHAVKLLKDQIEN